MWTKLVDAYDRLRADHAEDGDQRSCGPMFIVVHKPGVYVSWQQKMQHSSNAEYFGKWLALIAFLVGFAGDNGFGASLERGFQSALAFGVIAGLIMVALRRRTKHGDRWLDRPRVKRVRAIAIQQDGRFSWLFKGPLSETMVGGHAAQGSFTSFTIGHCREWFSSPNEEKTPYDDHLVMVIQPEGQAVQCVASHAGSRAELAQLLDVLTREFLVARTKVVPPDGSLAKGSDDLPENL